MWDNEQFDRDYSQALQAPPLWTSEEEDNPGGTKEFNEVTLRLHLLSLSIPYPPEESKEENEHRCRIARGEECLRLASAAQSQGQREFLVRQAETYLKTSEE